MFCSKVLFSIFLCPFSSGVIQHNPSTLSKGFSPLPPLFLFCLPVTSFSFLQYAQAIPIYIPQPLNVRCWVLLTKFKHRLPWSAALLANCTLRLIQLSVENLGTIIHKWVGCHTVWENVLKNQFFIFFSLLKMCDDFLQSLSAWVALCLFLMIKWKLKRMLLLL